MPKAACGAVPCTLGTQNPGKAQCGIECAAGCTGTATQERLPAEMTAARCGKDLLAPKFFCPRRPWSGEWQTALRRVGLQLRQWQVSKAHARSLAPRFLPKLRLACRKCWGFNSVGTFHRLY
jgi:hypothetical protein